MRSAAAAGDIMHFLFFDICIIFFFFFFSFFFLVGEGRILLFHKSRLLGRQFRLDIRICFLYVTIRNKMGCRRLLALLGTLRVKGRILLSTHKFEGNFSIG